MPAHQRRDQGQEPREVGGQVDVHVGEDGGVAVPPGRAERPPAALLLEAHRAHPGQLAAPASGRSRHVPSVLALSAIVMRAGNGNVRQERVQPADARARGRPPRRAPAPRRRATGNPGGPGTGMGARVRAGATGLGRGRWESLAAAVDMPRSVRAGPQTGVGSACASAGSSGARGNTTRKVAPRPGVESTSARPAVRLGDGRHDRQPQAAAAAGARPRRVGAEEALEHALGVVRREARAAVGHLDHGLLALRRARAR